MRVVDTERIPIKLWLEDIEEGAMAQARNLANLPFAYRWIAVMPDAHVGYGMPIGGVMATDQVIVPNAVGVDIGCFAGETMVPLLDGSQRSLRWLCDRAEAFWVYALDSNLSLVPGKATAIKTRTNAPVVRVTISGGAEIVCTPDHPFMMVDGTFKEAKDLQSLDSLMPLYRTYATRDGYESCITRNGKSVRTHCAVAGAIYGALEGLVVHHRDENRWNNAPENLQVLAPDKHSATPHAKKVQRLQSEEFKQTRLRTLRAKGFYAPHLAEKKRSVAKANITGYMRDRPEHFRRAVAANGERGRPYLVAYNKSAKGRAKSREIGSRVYTCEVCGLKGRGGFFLAQHRKSAHGNHKVIGVAVLRRRADVYCLTVEKHHNFALSAGVFVHNCGMIAARTDLQEIATEDIKDIMGRARTVIPLGFNHYSEGQEWLGFNEAPDLPVIQRELTSARKQLGTLGGGNHFIELQMGSDGFVWAMIHSGSRNFGLKVASEYHKTAQRLCENWHADIPDKDLAFLPIGGKEGHNYYAAMNYCMRFAQVSRELMMERLVRVIETVTGGMQQERMNVHHNYAAFEEHFGKTVLVHRKGATRAGVGERGIVPGSMGAHSYIVRGLGNPESFLSCSHGAGRRMGRKEAKRTLVLADEQAKMTGIVHGLRSIGDLDEAPGAYKDVEAVMAQQQDLVEIEVTLTPLASIKG